MFSRVGFSVSVPFGGERFDLAQDGTATGIGLEAEHGATKEKGSPGVVVAVKPGERLIVDAPGAPMVPQRAAGAQIVNGRLKQGEEQAAFGGGRPLAQELHGMRLA